MITVLRKQSQAIKRYVIRRCNQLGVRIGKANPRFSLPPDYSDLKMTFYQNKLKANEVRRLRESRVGFSDSRVVLTSLR